MKRWSDTVSDGAGFGVRDVGDAQASVDPAVAQPGDEGVLGRQGAADGLLVALQMLLDRGGRARVVFLKKGQCYRSMVADYAITDLGEPDDTWEEFANFAANVLAPERTLLEKITVFSLAARRTRERCRRGL